MGKLIESHSNTSRWVLGLSPLYERKHKMHHLPVEWQGQDDEPRQSDPRAP